MGLVEYSVRNRIAFIALNNPDRLNPLSDEMNEHLSEALFRLNDDEDALLGIISGNGRAFSSGGDVRKRQAAEKVEKGQFGGRGVRQAKLQAPIFRSSHAKPLIAAVHGYAYGAGLRLALYCDLLVAARDAKFQITEVTRGIDGTPFWMALMQRGGGGFANEVAMTGRSWTAEEGHAVGVVNRLSAPGEHVRVAETLAQEIMENPPLAVRAIVETRRLVLEEVYLKAYSMRPKNLHSSRDFRESARAFIEKRRPSFEGR